MDDALNDFEIDVLRVMNGEKVEGMVAGTGMLAAASFLKRRGYAAGHYHITEKGKAFLADLAASKHGGTE